MSNYIEQKDGTLTLGGMSIPADVGNRHYMKALAEVDSGDSTIEAYAGSQRESDDLAAEQAATEKAAADAAKLAGIEFNGVMCSATKEDMWGLSSVQSWIRAGQSTDFNFDNGNTLTLTPENIDAFEAVWVPFRASFF